MKVYLINVVKSDGYIDGTETAPIAARTPEAVIKMAYTDYSKSYDECVIEGIIDPDCDKFGFEEFDREMKKAFSRTHYAGYILIQAIDYHIQYEAYLLEV